MLKETLLNNEHLTVSDWKELVHVYNTQVQLLTVQNDILREEVELLRSQVKESSELVDIMRQHYNLTGTVANEAITECRRAGCLLDRVENYIPVLAVGKKMSEHPGRTPKVSDDTLLSLQDQGLSLTKIAEQVGLSVSTVSVRLKKIRGGV